MLFLLNRFEGLNPNRTSVFDVVKIVTLNPLKPKTAKNKPIITFGFDQISLLESKGSISDNLGFKFVFLSILRQMAPLYNFNILKLIKQISWRPLGNLCREFFFG